MDKFGIFNLLNSFFSLNPQKNENSPINQNSSGLANSLISSLGKGLINPSSKPNAEQKLPEPPKQSVPLPLQKSMLLTINSHDEIVKRVKEKNYKLTT